MKLSKLSKLIFCGLGVCAVQAFGQAAAPALKSPKEQISYATGVTAIRNFSKNDVAYDIELIIQGMRDAAAGRDLVMSEKEVRIAMNSLQSDLRRSMAANQRELSEKNRKRGSDFITTYRSKPDAQVMSNGVAYRVLKAGSGAKPAESDSVQVKYRGTSIDGVEFDATENDKAATLRVNQVIMGWREALKLMPTGSKWEIVVPTTLAYGERGVGNVIGPNETLVFEVELVGIKQ